MRANVITFSAAIKARGKVGFVRIYMGFPDGPLFGFLFLCQHVVSFSQLLLDNTWIQKTGQRSSFDSNVLALIPCVMGIELTDSGAKEQAPRCVRPILQSVQFLFQVCKSKVCRYVCRIEESSK